MTQFLTTVLAMTAFAGIAQARVLSIDVDKKTDPAQTLFTATIETCNGTYPSIVTKVRKVSDDSAVIAVRPSLDVSRCAGHENTTGFFLPIDGELKDLGLDVNTAHLYFQLQ